MEKKRRISIVLLIPTIIIGVALIKEFDVKQMSFENPALAIVYAIGLTIAVFFQFNNYKKPKE